VSWASLFGVNHATTFYLTCLKLSPISAAEHYCCKQYQLGYGKVSRSLIHWLDKASLSSIGLGRISEIGIGLGLC